MYDCPQFLRSIPDSVLEAAALLMPEYEQALSEVQDAKEARSALTCTRRRQAQLNAQEQAVFSVNCIGTGACRTRFGNAMVQAR